MTLKWKLKKTGFGGFAFAAGVAGIGMRRGNLGFEIGFQVEGGVRRARGGRDGVFVRGSLLVIRCVGGERSCCRLRW